MAVVTCDWDKDNLGNRREKLVDLEVMKAKHPMLLLDHLMTKMVTKTRL